MMDAGYAELEKHFEKVKHVSNSVSGTLYMDYDTNPDPFSFSWTNVTQTDNAPSYEYDISDSRKRNIMLRTRISTSDISDPTKNNLNAVVLDAFSRTPVKYNWVFPVRLKKYSKTLLGELDHDPETLFNQLNTWAGQAQELTLASVLPWMDAKTVVIEPLPMRYDVWTEDDAFVSGSVQVTLRET
jgi:hypothetical protein